MFLKIVIRIAKVMYFFECHQKNVKKCENKS